MLKNAFIQLRKNWIYSIAEKITFLCLVISLSLIIWRWRNIPPQIPLWYSRSWGADQLASPIWLFILSGSIVIWHLINVVISITFLKLYRVFIQALFITSTSGAILILITIGKILFMIS